MLVGTDHCGHIPESFIETLNVCTVPFVDRGVYVVLYKKVKMCSDHYLERLLRSVPLFHCIVY